MKLQRVEQLLRQLGRLLPRERLFLTECAARLRARLRPSTETSSLEVVEAEDSDTDDPDK